MSSVGDLGTIIEYHQEKVRKENKKILGLITCLGASVVYFLTALSRYRGQSDVLLGVTDTLEAYWYNIIMNRRK